MALVKDGRFAEAIGTLEELEWRYAEVPHRAIRRLVAVNLFDSATALVVAEQPAKAVVAYREAERRLVLDAEPVAQEMLAWALYGHAVCLAQLDQPEASVEALEELIERYMEASGPALQELVARALLTLGLTHERLGRRYAAVAALDEVQRRFGQASTPAIQEQVATARLDLARLLRQAGGTAPSPPPIDRARSPSLTEGLGFGNPVIWIVDNLLGGLGILAAYQSARQLPVSFNVAVAIVAVLVLTIGCFWTGWYLRSRLWSTVLLTIVVPFPLGLAAGVAAIFVLRHFGHF
jgi:tetratricopeptide (TPR) repeat protein